MRLSCWLVKGPVTTPSPFLTYQLSAMGVTPRNCAEITPPWQDEQTKNKGYEGAAVFGLSCSWPPETPEVSSPLLSSPRRRSGDVRPRAWSLLGPNAQPAEGHRPAR